MDKTLGKILIALGLLMAMIVLGRTFFYVPNGAVDSGLPVATTTASSTTDKVSIPGPLPDKLLIPKLGIEASVQHLGVTKTGNMAAPNNLTDVSWYELGTTPGKVGSAVMAGHVDNALSLPAIFYELPKLEIGDDVYVVDGDGKKLHFRVRQKELYRYDQAPAVRIFNDATGIYLNLITCQGEWVPAARSAENRLVVYTELVK